MAIGLVGTKTGMSRVFTEDGVSIPVTVIQIESNRVAQIKTVETDGYNAIQVTAGVRKSSKVNKPSAGHFGKANTGAGRGLWEFRLEDDEGAGFDVGSELGVDIFEPGQTVDVKGTSIGKGFAGVVKRHNFSMQDATHGNSISHRAPGSIGQCQTPGRVYKGKKMAGRMGGVTTTTQNLEIVSIDTERSLLIIKGAVPGCKGSNVVLKSAVKGQRRKV